MIFIRDYIFFKIPLSTVLVVQLHWSLKPIKYKILTFNGFNVQKTLTVLKKGIKRG